MYEVIILADEYLFTATQRLNHYSNQHFEFATLDEATDFAQICWDNCKDTVIRKSDLSTTNQSKVISDDQNDS